MTRKYELKRRAERLEETRQRIVDAAIALHTTLGPARTTVSAIAERAGVQRHTVYSHFPDERALGLACSACHVERRPLPDPSAWAAIADPEQRLRRGLTELYAYYARHGEELVPILRDMDHHPVTREMVDLRLRPAIDRIRDVLAAPFGVRGSRRSRLLAVVDLFLDLHTWRVLSRTAPPVDVVEAAVRAVGAQAGSQPPGGIAARGPVDIAPSHRRAARGRGPLPLIP